MNLSDPGGAGGTRRRAWALGLLLSACASGPAPTAPDPAEARHQGSEPALPLSAYIPAPAPSRSAAAARPAPVVAAAAPVGRGLARGTKDPSDRALGEGDRAYDADDLPVARAAYTRARRLAPKDPAPRVGLVRVRLAELEIPLSYAEATDDGRLRALATELQQVLRTSPEYGPAWLEHGRVALVLGDAPRAVASLRKACDRLPTDPEARSALGVALLASGDRNAALEQIRRAVELDATSPDRLANLGSVQLSVGHVSDAIRSFSRALALAPDDPRINNDLGTAYLAAGEPYRALPHLQRAVELDPRRATFLSNLGYALQLVRRFAEAEKTYRKALVYDDALVEAWINLATVQAKQNRLREARQALDRARKLAPDDPRVQVNLKELRDLERDAASRSGP